MDCGIPYCHAHRLPGARTASRSSTSSCGWAAGEEAIENLHSTNNFPEFTGRVCPAPCEPACTLALNDDAVTIKQIEYAIVEQGLEPKAGSRPSRRATEDRQDASRSSAPDPPGSPPPSNSPAPATGHRLRALDRIGGLLRYGIPDFKLDKADHRPPAAQMVAEGVEFQPGVNVGADISPQVHEAAVRRRTARDRRDRTARPHVPGRAEARNVTSPWTTSPSRTASTRATRSRPRTSSAKDKVVVVIGGGDTGSDCVGTAIRQGAKQVYQIELLDQPPDAVDPQTTWPLWPQVLRTSSSHKEGCERRWSISTTGFKVADGQAVELLGTEVEWIGMNGRRTPQAKAGSAFSMPVDLVLLACGFLHVEHGAVIEQLGIELNERGSIVVNDYQTNDQGVFAAGDCVRGASLVVHAIFAGRQAAAAMNRYLAAKAAS
jgi:glutamate synthase (NADPH/NADH) small chain